VDLQRRLSSSNKGRAGEETTEVKARFEADVVSERPHVVIICGHLNEFLREFAVSNVLSLLDFERALSGPDGECRPEFTLDDGSHITATGYETLADYVSTRLSARQQQ
jgi:hypothetical protein